MKQLRFIIPTTLLLMIVLVLSNLSVQAAIPPEASEHAVSVPSTAVSALNTLKLNPHLSIDYDSFQWLILSDSDLETLAASDVPYTVATDAGQLQIITHVFDPLVDGEPDIAASMRADATAPGFQLVQFAGPIKGDWLDDLTASGLPMLQYYPHNAYLTWGTAAETETAVSNNNNLRWSGSVHPAYKIDPYLLTKNGRINNVDIHFYNDGNLQATLDAVKATGATILQHYPAQPDKVFYDAVVQADAQSLDDLAQINTVLWMGYLGAEPILDDEMSAQIMAGNHPGGTPVTGYEAYLADVGYDGTGVIWAVIDTGVDYAHPDLNTHISGGYDYPGAPVGGGPGDDSSSGGHGTHVAGIIGGDAAAGFTDDDGFLYGLGVAPGVSFFASNSLSAAAWPPTGGWQEHSKQALLGGSVGGNNSWTTGEGTQHGYQASERTHDIMVRDGNFDTPAVAEPFIEVFSAGNSGNSGLTSPKEGKNLIVTAASMNGRGDDIDNIASFSSVGPAVDGRWVPTISAPGDSIASTRRIAGGSQCATAIAGTNNNYSWCSGTSMASPHASGAVVLFTEWWRSWNSNADPSPAMAKALVVNSAVDMGAADIPNINEGWGRINVTTILSPSVPFVYRDQVDVFNNTGEQIVFTMGVADPTKPLKITIAWSDAPGAVGANPALVNNLDLTVSNGGNTYLGNVFTSGWSATGGTADVLNNLENVYVENPGGDLTITIDATNIAGDAIPYNADTTDQDFVLVCQNCALSSDFTLSATPINDAICVGTDAIYTVNVGSVLGFTDPVTLSASGNPAGTTTDFTVNPVTPAGSSDLTIGNTAGAAFGNYSIDIVGIAPTSTHTTTVGLDVYDSVPDTPGLTTPANGATNVGSLPTLVWNATAQTGSYLLEVATDAGFNTLVYTSTVMGDSHTIPNGSDLNTSTTYYWRVSASNTCGDSGYSSTFMFTTVAAPGDCGPGTAPATLFSDDFESGASGWTHSAGVGADTWTLSGSNTHSGSFVYHADDSGALSDQYLVSPAVVLPTGEAPLTMQFWNYQEMEDSGAGCFDGSVVEISTDGGSNWTRLESELLTDPYDGLVDSGYGNPLAGENAWCGDAQDWLNSIVDIDGWAGQTVQFRYRIATDSSVGHPGWDIDDVKVQSCQDTGYVYDVSLSDDDALSGEAGGIITYTVWLTNTGNITDTFTLSNSGMWTADVAPANVTLASGATSSVTVTVSIPMNGLIGEMDVTTITAVSQGNSSVSATVDLTTTVDTVFIYLPAILKP